MNYISTEDLNTYKAAPAKHKFEAPGLYAYIDMHNNGYLIKIGGLPYNSTSYQVIDSLVPSVKLRRAENCVEAFFNETDCANISTQQTKHTKIDDDVDLSMFNQEYISDDTRRILDDADEVNQWVIDTLDKLNNIQTSRNDSYREDEDAWDEHIKSYVNLNRELNAVLPIHMWHQDNSLETCQHHQMIQITKRDYDIIIKSFQSSSSNFADKPQSKPITKPRPKPRSVKPTTKPRPKPRSVKPTTTKPRPVKPTTTKPRTVKPTTKPRPKPRSVKPTTTKPRQESLNDLKSSELQLLIRDLRANMTDKFKYHSKLTKRSQRLAFMMFVSSGDHTKDELQSKINELIGLK